MSVAGIGIDIVSIDRFKSAAEQRGEGFLKKIFTQNELDYASTKPDPGHIMHMAGKLSSATRFRIGGIQ